MLLRLLPLLLIGTQCCIAKVPAEQKAKKLPAFEKPWLVVTPFRNFQDTVSKKSLSQGGVYLYHLRGTEQSWPAKWLGQAKFFKSVSLSEFLSASPEGYMLVPLDSLNGSLKVVILDTLNYFSNPGSWPLKEPGQQPFPFQKAVSLVSITGVTAITRASGIAADNQGIDFLTQNLKPYFTQTDLMHISNEVSFTADCTYPRGGTKFCTKKEHFRAITDLGCDVVELTGNHNRDHGSNAFISTYQWYLDQGIVPFGGGRNEEEANTPAVFTLKDSTRIGFIGFNELCPLGECASGSTPGANRYDREKARSVIRKMREELHCDIIVASVQFGEIDSYAPSETQPVICRDLVDFGADYVYGSQAHQIQQFEWYKGKPVYYGLGNFLFDQVHRIGVRQAFFLQNYFYKGRLIATVPVFTFMSADRQPAIASEAEEWVMKSVVYPR